MGAHHRAPRPNSNSPAHRNDIDVTSKNDLRHTVIGKDEQRAEATSRTLRISGSVARETRSNTNTSGAEATGPKDTPPRGAKPLQRVERHQKRNIGLHHTQLRTVCELVHTVPGAIALPRAAPSSSTHISDRSPPMRANRDEGSHRAHVETLMTKGESNATLRHTDLHHTVAHCVRDPASQPPGLIAPRTAPPLVNAQMQPVHAVQLGRGNHRAQLMARGHREERQ